MAEPTKTRAQLRRAVGQALHMPFFDKFEEGSTISGTPTTSYLVDTALGESDGYWENMWAIITSGSASPDVRRIIDHDRSANRLTLDYALSATPSIGDSYEIYSGFSPHAIHRKLNDAIEEAFPAFFEMIEAEEFVICTDTFEYDLSTYLSQSPWRVYAIWLERASRAIRIGKNNVVSSNSGLKTIEFESTVDLSDVDSTWLISCFDGDWENYPTLDPIGHFDTIASVSGQTITRNGDSTWPTLGAGSDSCQFLIWKPREQESDWYRVPAARFHPNEFPDTLYLTRSYEGFEGMRVRMIYSAKPSPLSSESSTSIVPEAYLRHKAINLLATDMMSDTRVDRSKWERLASIHFELAEQIKASQYRKAPNTTIWQEKDITEISRGFGDNDGNPLGWR